jgi:hypothetical protein
MRPWRASKYNIGKSKTGGGFFGHSACFYVCRLEQVENPNDQQGYHQGDQEILYAEFLMSRNLHRFFSSIRTDLVLRNSFSQIFSNV